MFQVRVSFKFSTMQMDIHISLKGSSITRRHWSPNNAGTENHVLALPIFCLVHNAIFSSVLLFTYTFSFHRFLRRALSHPHDMASLCLFYNNCFNVPLHYFGLVPPQFSYLQNKKTLPFQAFRPCVFKRTNGFGKMGMRLNG